MMSAAVPNASAATPHQSMGASSGATFVGWYGTTASGLRWLPGPALVLPARANIVSVRSRTVWQGRSSERSRLFGRRVRRLATASGAVCRV